MPVEGLASGSTTVGLAGGSESLGGSRDSPADPLSSTSVTVASCQTTCQCIIGPEEQILRLFRFPFDSDNLRVCGRTMP